MWWHGVVWHGEGRRRGGERGRDGNIIVREEEENEKGVGKGDCGQQR